PMGFGAGDPDLYRYVCNNPANNVDPSGMIFRLTRDELIKILDEHIISNREYRKMLIDWTNGAEKAGNDFVVGLIRVELFRSGQYISQLTRLKNDMKGTKQQVFRRIDMIAVMVMRWIVIDNQTIDAAEARMANLFGQFRNGVGSIREFIEAS